MTIDSTPPSASDLAQERYEDNAPVCAVQGHGFDRSRETDEPIGRCYRCGISVEGAEREDEERDDG